MVASPNFDLADVWDAVSGKGIKREKPILALPNAPIPIKVSGSSCKKRKRTEILDLTIEDSEPVDIMNK